MSKMKLLVTGSGGFIFSNFVRYVLKNYSTYSVASIDRCNSPKVLNTIYSNKGHSFHIGDVADEHFVNVIFEMEKPDYVIHGAAQSFVEHSPKEALEFIHSNVLGTQVITNACITHNVKKLLYISTNEVYGQLGQEGNAWNEEQPIQPRNSYSATKAAGELIVKAASNTHGLNYNIARICNNYGPRQPNYNLIPLIITNILNNKEVPIYGRGEQIRDWIHVQDNCSALLKILESGNNNDTYNISAKQEFMNIEVFHEICNVLGRGHELLSFIKDRPGHDFRYAITNDKLKELGWKPEFKFRDGLFHTIKWYQNNTWFLR